MSIEAQHGWLIHKAGRGWYRPDAHGYTSDPAQAGRYSYDEAVDRSHPNGKDGPRDGMTIKHESELVPAPAVPDDVAQLVAELRVIGCHENGVARCTCGIGMDAADALEAQAAELARLRADIDQGAKDYCDLMEQRDALLVRAKALEAALRPFVAYVHDDLRKGKATYELVAVDRHGGGLIGAEDLRRARAALTHPTGGTDYGR